MLGPSCSEGASRKTDWKLDIPDLDNVPPYSPPIPPLNVKNFSKILHLSDLHVQKNYTIGNVLKIFISYRYFLGKPSIKKTVKIEEFVSNCPDTYLPTHIQEILIWENLIFLDPLPAFKNSGKLKYFLVYFFPKINQLGLAADSYLPFRTNSSIFTSLSL